MFITCTYKNIHVQNSSRTKLSVETYPTFFVKITYSWIESRTIGNFVHKRTNFRVHVDSFLIRFFQFACGYLYFGDKNFEVAQKNVKLNDEIENNQQVILKNIFYCRVERFFSCIVLSWILILRFCLTVLSSLFIHIRFWLCLVSHVLSYF